MSKFKLDIAALEADMNQLKGVEAELFCSKAILTRDILKLRYGSGGTTSAMLRQKLGYESSKISKEISNIYKITNAGNRICAAARDAEFTALARIRGELTIMARIRSLIEHLRNLQVGLKNAVGTVVNAGFLGQGGFDIGKLRAAATGLLAGSGTIASFSNQYSHGETHGGVKYEYDLKNRKAEISAEAGASAALAKGKVSGSFGKTGSYSAEGSFLSAEAKGKVTASLFDKDGKLNPNINLAASAEAKVLSGSASVKAGNDMLGGNASAKGDLLGAEAKAKASVSKNGVSAEASAEAYLARGEVKGGINILGIKIGAKAEGYVGAGAHAKGSVTSSGASLDIGAAVGLGLGAEISIDWSGCPVYKAIKGIASLKDKLPSMKTVEGIAKNVYNGVKNTAGAIGSGIKKIGKWLLH